MCLLYEFSNDKLTKQLSLEPKRSKAEGETYEERHSPKVQSRHCDLCYVWIDIRDRFGHEGNSR